MLCMMTSVSAAEPVSALIHHETTDVSPDGVTRIARYEERLYRDDDQVWIERIKPARAAKTIHEVDVHVGARWYTRAGDRANVVIVSVPDRVIIDVGPASMDAQELTDRWVVAAGLVDRATLAPSSRPASAGTRWYERTGARDYLRVLWSTRFGLPLEIETGTTDGTHRSRTTLRPSTGFTPPWSSTVGFRRIDLSDLGD